jgi:hypothetical protein
MICPNDGRPCHSCKPNCCGALEHSGSKTDPMNESEMPQPSPFTDDRNPVVKCHGSELPCICNGTLCRRASRAPVLEWRTCPVSQQVCTDQICQSESLCRLHTSDFITYQGVRALFRNTGADGWAWSFTLGTAKFGGAGPMPDVVLAFKACVDMKMEVLRVVQSVGISESWGGR